MDIHDTRKSAGQLKVGTLQIWGWGWGQVFIHGARDRGISPAPLRPIDIPTLVIEIGIRIEVGCSMVGFGWPALPPRPHRYRCHLVLQTAHFIISMINKKVKTRNGTISREWCYYLHHKLCKTWLTFQIICIFYPNIFVLRLVNIRAVTMQQMLDREQILQSSRSTLLQR